MAYDIDESARRLGDQLREKCSALITVGVASNDTLFVYIDKKKRKGWSSDDIPETFEGFDVEIKLIAPVRPAKPEKEPKNLPW